MFIFQTFISKKYPLKSPNDENYNKKSGRNVFFSFLLNFGGGVLFANCFCHWLPEIREGIFSTHKITVEPQFTGYVEHSQILLKRLSHTSLSILITIFDAKK